MAPVVEPTGLQRAPEPMVSNGVLNQAEITPVTCRYSPAGDSVPTLLGRQDAKSACFVVDTYLFEVNYSRVDVFRFIELLLCHESLPGKYLGLFTQPSLFLARRKYQSSVCSCSTYPKIREHVSTPASTF